jgi:hypothetical protein
MADPDGLKELGGAASAFIGMMGTAIVALAGALGVMWKHSSKVYGFRLAERDTLTNALNAATKAQEAQTRAMEEQNRVIADLADAIREQATMFEKLHERLGMQQEHARERERDQRGQLDDQTKAITEMSNSIRVLTGILTDVRNKLIKDGVII